MLHKYGTKESLTRYRNLMLSRGRMPHQNRRYNRDNALRRSVHTVSISANLMQGNLRHLPFITVNSTPNEDDNPKGGDHPDRHTTRATHPGSGGNSDPYFTCNLMTREGRKGVPAPGHKRNDHGDRKDVYTRQDRLRRSHAYPTDTAKLRSHVHMWADRRKPDGGVSIVVATRRAEV